jgi:hypothetical protein
MWLVDPATAAILIADYLRDKKRLYQEYLRMCRISRPLSSPLRRAKPAKNHPWKRFMWSGQ